MFHMQNKCDNTEEYYKNKISELEKKQNFLKDKASFYEVVSKDVKRFDEFLEDYYKNLEKYNSTTLYITSDYSVVKPLYDNLAVVFGIIVDSPFKSQIGTTGSFLKTELQINQK